MALVNKPAAKPKWAVTPGSDTNGSFLSTPPDSKQNVGWTIEKPPVQYMNWLFNLIYQWILYFDTHSSEFDAVVSTETADLKTTLAAASAGWKILVIENQSITSSVGTIALSLSNVEIVLKPGVTISKAVGGPAIGILVTGTNCRIKGGKISGWNGGSDVAVSISGGGTRCKITEVDFSTNTTDVNDTLGDAVITACNFSS